MLEINNSSSEISVKTENSSVDTCQPVLTAKKRTTARQKLNELEQIIEQQEDEITELRGEVNKLKPRRLRPWYLQLSTYLLLLCVIAFIYLIYLTYYGIYLHYDIQIPYWFRKIIK